LLHIDQNTTLPSSPEADGLSEADAVADSEAVADGVAVADGDSLGDADGAADLLQPASNTTVKISESNASVPSFLLLFKFDSPYKFVVNAYNNDYRSAANPEV